MKEEYIFQEYERHYYHVLANHFGVSIDYLFGITNIKNHTYSNDFLIVFHSLTPTQIEVMRLSASRFFSLQKIIKIGGRILPCRPHNYI